jgi:hypothetical protein
MNTRQFVTANHIRADVNYADRNPNLSNAQWATDANHWKITLRMGRRQMSVPFSTGSALGEPDAADVLDCLASDASTELYTSSFEDWASELGLDPDSRTAYRTFEITHRQTRRLRAFLGEDLFDALLTETERL